MTVAAPQSRFTPSDLLNLDQDNALLYELVDGELVEKQMSSEATETVGIVTGELYAYVKRSRAGKIYPEQAFQCFPDDPDLIRRPDLAFITAKRLGGVPRTGHVSIAPDLAIEVVSPNDKIYELDDKLVDYRAAGVKMIWVINPSARMIRIHHLDRTVEELGESDTLISESILPGFSILVKDLLPPISIDPPLDQT